VGPGFFKGTPLEVLKPLLGGGTLSPRKNGGVLKKSRQIFNKTPGGGKRAGKKAQLWVKEKMGGVGKTLKGGGFSHRKYL